MRDRILKTLFFSYSLITFSDVGYCWEHLQTPNLQTFWQQGLKAVAEFKIDLFQLGNKHSEKDHITFKEPFVLEDESGLIRVSSFIKSEQDTLLIMNDLSYNLIKDAQTQMKLNFKTMEKLKTLGWQMVGFSGLEGRRNTYPDMSGMIFYNPKRNLIIVVYRGTGGNKDGWDTNFDAAKINPYKIQKEFCKDLYDEVVEIVRSSDHYEALKGIKKIIRKAQEDDLNLAKANETYSKVTSYIKEQNLEEHMTVGIINAFDQKLELMSTVDKIGSNIEGEVHKGFLKKYLSTKNEVLGILKNHIKGMSPDQKKKLKIIFTGHSQAGATGNLALTDICINHGKELFGKKFKNQTDFRFYGYYLSAARAGDKAYRKWVHQHLGKSFIIRQNVEGDPTPVSSGDEKMAEYVERIPVIGEILAKRIAQFDDTGYLLLDDGHKVWKRARDLYEQEGYDIDKFTEVEDFVRYLASWVIEDQSAIPKYLAPKKDGDSFLWSPLRWTKSRIKAAKTFNLIRQSFNGDQEALKELEALKDLFISRYAHLHYGHHKPEIGAAFDPYVVGRDLDSMAIRGKKHIEEKQFNDDKKIDKFTTK